MRDALPRIVRPSHLALLAFLVALLTTPGSILRAQDATLPALTPGTRVYDETGASLSPEQTQDLEERLAALVAIGPDAVVVVRNRMASPDETMDQVEAVQQQWAAVAGIGDENAVAILINRNPDDANDARAGIFVGRNLDDGNVPEREQRAIVEDELIPPLRNGDVYTSLVEALTRLESSYLNGPPRSAGEKWADDASSSWLAPVGVALAVAFGGIAAWLVRKRETRPRLPLPPSTQRPDDLHPALGGALATGGPQASAVPATTLRLAEQGFIVFEQESAGGMLSKPTLRVRLIREPSPDDKIDRVVWDQLVRRSEEGVVSSGDLRRVAGDTRPSRTLLDRILRERGWTRDGTSGIRNGLLGIGALSGLLAAASLVTTAVGGNWFSVIAAVALIAAAIASFWGYARFSPFTRAGQEVAAPWQAYRQGLETALKQQSTPIDLNAVLTDAVAMNLGNIAGKRVEAAQEAGVVLNAFANVDAAAAFPVWIAFSSSMASASGTGSATVSGGGAGGGGGAAGST